MKDRVVQYPNRYKLVPVAGTTDTFDIVPAPGVVTEQGTDLNKAALLSDEAAALLGLAGDPVPSDAFVKLQSNMLYEKIRDIPDTSATTSLSIAITDIDWNVWRSIRLICEAKCESVMYVRFNSQSNNKYKNSRLTPGSAASGTTMTYITELHDRQATSFANLDLELERWEGWNSPAFHIHTAQYNNDSFRSGICVYDYLATWSTINLVSSTSGKTVYLRNASLWGMRK